MRHVFLPMPGNANLTLVKTWLPCYTQIQMVGMV